jgi:hypothetical protein
MAIVILSEAKDLFWAVETQGRPKKVHLRQFFGSRDTTAQ